MVAMTNSFLLNCSSFVGVCWCCVLQRCSAICLEGNSVSQTYPKSRARWIASPAKVGKTFSKLGTHMLVVEETLVSYVLASFLINTYTDTYFAAKMCGGFIFMPDNKNVLIHLR